jgi:hypothetical protein
LQGGAKGAGMIFMVRRFLGRFALLVAVAVSSAAAVPNAAFAHAGHAFSVIPANQPDKGLVYDDLETGTPLCPKAFKLRGRNLCTHGPDAPARGYDVTTSVAPVTRIAATPGIDCDGDGTSGKRIQVLYVRSSDRPDRYATYLPSIRAWAAGADAIYSNSAAETGGFRRIRYVHDAGCDVSVPNLVLSPRGDDTFSNTMNELDAMGYALASRKYMLFVDANVYCGIGSLWNDDQAGSANFNNAGLSYGRTDAGCWGGDVPAHELMHNLGGVQLSAPNSSGGYHCTDEWDRMCYSDTPDSRSCATSAGIPARTCVSTAITTTTSTRTRRPATTSRRTGMRPTATG